MMIFQQKTIPETGAHGSHAPAQIPTRQEVSADHCWNLSSLFSSAEDWQKHLSLFEQEIEALTAYSGRLGESAEVLGEFLDAWYKWHALGERLAYYAFLRVAEDGENQENQQRYGKYMQVATIAGAQMSFVEPELQHIPDEKMAQMMPHERLTPYRIAIEKILRFKPHILSQEQERLLALQQEANITANKAFEALTNIDLDFGTLDTPDGMQPLTHASFGSFMLHADRELRRTAYAQYMAQFDAHKNTLASLLAGSVNLDIYQTRVRKHSSARARALFPDKISEDTYDGLIAAVRKGLPTLHRYYELRRRVLALPHLSPYDVRVPLVPAIRTDYSYEQASEMVLTALAVLGEEYTTTLRNGLYGGWVDRFENKGKQSGAFSAGSYHGDPYILLNYRNDNIREVFTIAHEAGHSMHSWYSTNQNPFPHYQYTIFEAEVASTVNEQLLFYHLCDITKDEQMRTFLINMQVDNVIATLFRQTMFAEYEQIIHTFAEQGQPLTLDTMRRQYRQLLETYFGESTKFEAISDLECFRIPHFYRAFYVYKYATGISAAIAIADRIRQHEKGAVEHYFSFLRSGGSRYPLEALALTGVDMARPDAIHRAIAVCDELITQLENAL